MKFTQLVQSLNEAPREILKFKDLKLSERLANLIFAFASLPFFHRQQNYHTILHTSFMHFTTMEIKIAPSIVSHVLSMTWNGNVCLGVFAVLWSHISSFAFKLLSFCCENIFLCNFEIELNWSKKGKGKKFCNSAENKTVILKNMDRYGSFV